VPTGVCLWAWAGPCVPAFASCSGQDRWAPAGSIRRPECQDGSDAYATIDCTPLPNLKGAGMTSSEQAQGESLTSKVSGWLEKQGYPLEMRVARVLQEEGAYVIQSDYYTDRATGTSREIDVVATWDMNVGDVIVRINFTIECKGTRHKPWVMFVSDSQRLGSVASVAQRASSGIGGAALWHMADERAVQDLAMFRLPRLCGYSLAPMQDKNNEKDECFTALTGVAAATAAQAAMPDFQNGRSGTIEILEVIFPIIVTDAPLCTARLNQKSELVVEEAKSGVVLWRNPVVGFPHTLVHVVTGQEFDSFATEMADSVVKFLKMCEGPMLSHIHKAVAEARQARVLTSRKSLDDILR